MKLIKKIVLKIFNKRYNIQNTKNEDLFYACNRRIIRSFSEEKPKKTYCAAYVLNGYKSK